MLRRPTMLRCVIKFGVFHSCFGRCDYSVLSTQSLPPVEPPEIELVLSKVTVLTMCHELFLPVFLFLNFTGIGFTPYLDASLPLSLYPRCSGLQDIIGFECSSFFSRYLYPPLYSDAFLSPLPTPTVVATLTATTRFPGIPRPRMVVDQAL